MTILNPYFPAILLGKINISKNKKVFYKKKTPALLTGGGLFLGVI